MAKPLPTIAELEATYPDWRDKLTNLYEQGGTQAEVQKELGLGHTRWSNLMRCNEFKAAVEWGRILQEAYFDKLGREHILNPKFNTSLYSIMRQNLHGWGLRQVIEGNQAAKVAITVDYVTSAPPPLREGSVYEEAGS